MALTIWDDCGSRQSYAAEMEFSIPRFPRRAPKKSKKVIDMKTALRLFSGILAAPPLLDHAGEDKKDGKLMKHIYSQITAEWVGVSGAAALALCSDRLRSIRPTAPFTNMQQTTITDP